MPPSPCFLDNRGLPLSQEKKTKNWTGSHVIFALATTYSVLLRWNRTSISAANASPPAAGIYTTQNFYLVPNKYLFPLFGMHLTFVPLAKEA